MRNVIRLAAAAAALLLAGCSQTPQTGEEQALVDRATLTVQELLGGGNDRVDAQRLLRRSRAVMICPRIFRAGFFFGGSGGMCVMAARDAAGSWSSPAFYAIHGGSFGLQAGIEDAQVMMIIMNDKALNAMLDSQFKFGADASIAVATVGGSVEGATTAAVGADIVSVAQSRGLFAGLTLGGALLSARSEWNRGYYGRDVGSRQIVMSMEAHNPGSDPLRAVLMRFGAPSGPAGESAQPPPAATGASRAAAPAGSAASSGASTSGGVQRSTLPPLR
jgi:lipid-binding SYLF domain-containing protein